MVHGATSRPVRCARHHPRGMNERLKTIGVLGSTYASFERELNKVLKDLPADRLVSISYSTSRILTIWLQHHALIVIRESG